MAMPRVQTQTGLSCVDVKKDLTEQEWIASMLMNAYKAAMIAMPMRPAMTHMVHSLVHVFWDTQETDRIAKISTNVRKAFTTVMAMPLVMIRLAPSSVLVSQDLLAVAWIAWMCMSAISELTLVM